MTEFEKEVLRNGTSETRIMLWMSKAADFCDMCRLMTEQDIKGLKEILTLMGQDITGLKEILKRKEGS